MRDVQKSVRVPRERSLVSPEFEIPDNSKETSIKSSLIETQVDLGAGY